jgi:DNA-binding response OmpR family regulator
MTIRVMVVEDEAILAIDIAEQLTEAGFVIVGPATSVAKALKLVAEVGCDVAVLDVNLRDETAEPIARALRSSGKPFLFLSAGCRENLPPGFGHELLLAKPARTAVLVEALRSLSNSATPGRGVALSRAP